MTAENPFDPLGYATGAELFGRDEELRWLTESMRQGANVLLFGGDGAGKSSLLQEAARALGERGEAYMIRVDLAVHRSTAGITQALDAAGNILSQTGVSGRPTTQQANFSQPGVAFLGGSVATASQVFGDPLQRSMQKLNTIAQVQRVRVVIAFDSMQALDRGTQQSVAGRLVESVRQNRSLSHIFITTERAVIAPATAEMDILQQSLLSRRIAPLEPCAFGRWIDERFASAGVTGRGVGAACIDIAGPNTREVIALAKQTFAVSVGVGFANGNTVHQALSRMIVRTETQQAALWATLSTAERALVSALARAGGAAFADPTVAVRTGFVDRAQLSLVIQGLVDRGIITGYEKTGLAVTSVAFRQWTLQLGTNLGIQSVGQRSARFSFDFQLTNKLTVAQSPSL